MTQSDRRRLQAGGTLNPQRHIYIRRPQDDRLLKLLLAGEYVNVLTSRQMGKSSLMVRTAFELQARGVRYVSIDLASTLGSDRDAQAYYLGLIGQIARSLELPLDVGQWWRERPDETFNQRLLRFFREVVATGVDGRVVVFLDEIDSTLKLPFTDDLFTAIRGMYNERSLVPVYERIGFCLLGVATPNELIKDRRTTPYNVGYTLELDDFDSTVEDLTPIIRALSADAEVGRRLLERVLHWTGGHPYLTVKLCVELQESRAGTAADVDRYIEANYGRLERVSADAHFQQIQRFVAHRLGDSLGALDLYERILEGRPEHDQATLIHAALKLSGLVKRNAEGWLIVRNRLYARLFDHRWIADSKPRREVARYRQWALAATILLAITIAAAGAFFWWASVHEYPPGIAAKGLLTRIGLLSPLEPEMVTVPAGSFQMGSPENEEGRDGDEGPMRTVTFTQPFEVGKYEVTFAEYDRFAAATGRPLPGDQGWGRGDRPVINVSWEDATAYAQWLAEQTGKGYRLLTEAEWEYAARAGTDTSRYWSDEPNEACAYANAIDETFDAADTAVEATIKAAGWWGKHECEDQFVYTAPVGTYDPNAFELHDMLGNVLEWTCSEVYSGAEQECARKYSASSRVLRGGSWGDVPRDVRSASRYGWPAGFRDGTAGFRLARSD